MAQGDNITTGQSGAVVSTNLVGGVHVPRGKMQFGVDGAASDVHGGNPLPVESFSSLFFLGTTTALAAAATYTGASRDAGVVAGALCPFAFFNTFFLADQAGTANLEGSNDGATWYTAATSAATANAPLILTVPVLFRYHRARFVNGATAQTTFIANSSYTAS